MRVIDGIMYCTEHGGISAEGTDYHPDGLGCEYPERESDEPCVLVPMFWDDGQNSTANGTELTCTCVATTAYRQLDRQCPTHGDDAEAQRRGEVTQ